MRAWSEGPGSIGQLVYGVNDCCQFVGTVLQRVTGVDYRAGFDYGTEGAADWLVHMHGSLRGLASDALGIQPVPLAHLAPGDPIHFDRLGESGLGIYLGPVVAVLDQLGAVRTLPARISEEGWPVQALQYQLSRAR